MSERITRIRKRDGSVVEFESSKIEVAIRKALGAVNRDATAAPQLSERVVQELVARFPGSTPSVEDVQNVVEVVLMGAGLDDVARAYILYRKRRAEIRETKAFLGVQDDLKLSVNAVSVLRRRYLLKDEKGNVVETPRQMFTRVARAVASADKVFDENADSQKTENEFFEMMANLEFLPNSPTLMNAGLRLGQLSACFVIPVEDSLPSIFDAVKNAAIIHQSGGGCGFSFSRLRPKGDIVGSTMGVASGPVSFMRIVDTATDVIKQGGKRRGANMGILRCDHPDILEFMTAKSKQGFLSNFNLSVAVTDDFMRKVESGEEYDLTNPRTGEAARRARARDIFNIMVTMAWSTGDPGVVFIDEVNRHNPTPQVGTMESTNPCGEQPLLPYESCNLGSINLVKMVSRGRVEWDELRGVVRKAVHFLDNVIEINKYPLPEVERITRANRKIGLGVMGFAEMLILLGIPYDSDAALSLGENVMEFISDEATKASVELAKSRGSFPNFKGSRWERKGFRELRNATLTTVAPTGTISIIGSCSSGIEPLFAVCYVRNVLEGTRLLEVNPIFEQMAREKGFYSDALMMEIAKTGTVKASPQVPEDVKRLFVTALDVSPAWHVKMQAVFQKCVDNAVSKTINLPNDATVEDVREAYLLAYGQKCKGITVYRYGSKPEQVLYLGSVAGKESGEMEYVSAGPEYAGGCPDGRCDITF